VEDCQNGLGQESWNDDSHYKGNYLKGKKQGIGSYKWADGSRYEGEWYENCLHGYVHLILLTFLLGNILL
jgi:hypothetical protein